MRHRPMGLFRSMVNQPGYCCLCSSHPITLLLVTVILNHLIQQSLHPQKAKLQPWRHMHDCVAVTSPHVPKG